MHEVACPQHATDADREIAAAHRLGWRAGLACGEEEREALTADVYRLLKELGEKGREAAFRTEYQGGQIVTVDTGYAYVWYGETPLRVGDRVKLPSSWLHQVRSDLPTVAEVVGLGTNYHGTLVSILHRIPRSDSADSAVTEQTNSALSPA